MTPASTSARLVSTAGYSLIEMMIAMGLMTVVMGATLGSLSDVVKWNDAVVSLTTMNDSLRSGMDLMVRDLLQVGSGLPPGHNVTIPHGDGAVRLRLPGPPGSAFETAAGATSIPAVIPWPGGGPQVNGVATDVLTVLMADNTFLDVALTAVTATTVSIAAGPVLDAGPDRVTPGQLMMVTKGSQVALVQVTDVDTATRTLTFAAGDSLNLNQPDADNGTLDALDDAAPAQTPASTFVSRLRMITYYIDAITDASHPRLVRRVNNGHPTAFNNTLGTAVAHDMASLQLTYDISNGTNNPGNIEMTDSDTTTTTTCTGSPCAATQIRKVNLQLTGRSRNAANTKQRVFHNTLTSQVALRGMAFVDEYRSEF